MAVCLLLLWGNKKVGFEGRDGFIRAPKKLHLRSIIDLLTKLLFYQSFFWAIITLILLKEHSLMVVHFIFKAFVN